MRANSIRGLFVRGWDAQQMQDRDELLVEWAGTNKVK